MRRPLEADRRRRRLADLEALRERGGLLLMRTDALKGRSIVAGLVQPAGVRVVGSSP